MNERQSKLLVAIIDHFVETAIPVGSKELQEHARFMLSCATIRNEMRVLGEEGFLEQPHVSAGRVPTAKGYRVYVQEFMEPTVHEKQARARFDDLRRQYVRRKDQERVYEAVALLSHMTPNVAFATVPHKPRVYFLGLANVLRQPEFQSDTRLASGVVEILETRLTDILEGIQPDDRGDRVRYYIGDEHVLPQIQSCSLMVKAYRMGDECGTLGIMGPMRMDYAYNTTALDLVSDLLRSADA